MRVGILGVSHWHAGHHSTAIREAGAELAGVWDDDAGIAAAFATQEQAEPFASLDAALDAACDLLIVLGRGPRAAVLVGELLARPGPPLLLDKPLGLSAADVAPLVEAAAGRLVTVALPSRTAGLLAEAAALRAAGEIGPISHMQFRLLNGPPSRYPQWGVGWMLDPAQSGGGALRNLGVHGVDAFLALAGAQDVTLESASFGPGVHGAAVEDYACLVLRAADGMLGLVEAGYSVADPKAGFTAWRLDGRGASLWDDGTRLLLSTAAGTVERPNVPVARRYGAYLAEVLACLREARQPPLTLADFARATALIDTAYARR
ncbi:MAG: Gfo/Idh/MocA family oxidoreductase [Acetobacteraceae bacterium]|nr:Gfo/Idh/MocA family oxidoreductase [Acetobacteraceae bacterium]